MTSDAKIGLLLGLVFIFVIAFIINGLPNLRPQAGKGEVTTNMTPTEESFGVADKAQKAQELLNWGDLLAQPPAEQAAAGTASEQTHLALSPASSPTADAPQTRPLLSLPSIDSLLNRLIPPKSETVVMDPTPTTTQPPVATERPPAVEPVPARAAESTTAEIQAAAARSVGTLEKAGWKVYTVGEGENLAAVAKKVYGPQDGNRIANIKRIYEANKDILKSLDQVSVGQKLVIPPPLPPLPAPPAKPEDVLSQALFEKVDAIGKQGTARTATNPPTAPQAKPPTSPQTKPPAAGVRWYVVQDGDNLWKIAASQLGSGTRYEEIAKLNADLLKSRDTLEVGMRIRLPAK